MFDFKKKNNINVLRTYQCTFDSIYRKKGHQSAKILFINSLMYGNFFKLIMIRSIPTVTAKFQWTCILTYMEGGERPWSNSGCRLEFFHPLQTCSSFSLDLLAWWWTLRLGSSKEVCWTKEQKKLHTILPYFNTCASGGWVVNELLFRSSLNFDAWFV